MAAVDFLQFRERLKDGFRKKMNQEQQISSSSFPKGDNYGSFFGPSEPTIAPRVLEISQALLENPPKPEKLRLQSSKTKAQVIKRSRDYSFLTSDDTSKEAKPESARSKTTVSEAQKSDSSGSKSSMESLKNSQVKGKPLKGMEEEEQFLKSQAKRESCSKIAKGLAMKTKAHGPKPSKTAAQVQKYARDYSFLSSDGAPPQRSKLSDTKSNMASSSTNGNGPVQSAGPNNLPSKVPVPRCVKPADTITRKQIISKTRIEPVQSSGPKGGKSLPREKPVLSTKPKHGAETLGALTTTKEARPKKRPRWEPFDNDNDVDPGKISEIIRAMYKYNPHKYVRDDRDDINMEASYHEIQKEERRSAKIARKEDQEELQKIIEEERKEKMMKKKLKT